MSVSTTAKHPQYSYTDRGKVVSIDAYASIYCTVKTFVNINVHKVVFVVLGGKAVGERDGVHHSTQEPEINNA